MEIYFFMIHKVIHTQGSVVAFFNYVIYVLVLACSWNTGTVEVLFK